MSETAQTPLLSPMLTHSLMTDRRPTKNLTPHRTDAEDHEREIFRLEEEGEIRKKSGIIYRGIDVYLLNTKGSH